MFVCLGAKRDVALCDSNPAAPSQRSIVHRSASPHTRRRAPCRLQANPSQRVPPSVAGGFQAPEWRFVSRYNIDCCWPNLQAGGRRLLIAVLKAEIGPEEWERQQVNAGGVGRGSRAAGFL